MAVWAVVGLSGDEFLTAGRDGVVHRWEHGVIVNTAEELGELWSATVTPTGDQVAVGGTGFVRLLNSTTLEEDHSIKVRTSWGLTFSEDRLVIAGSPDHSSVAGHWHLPSTVRDVSLSPRGDLLVTGTWASWLAVIPTEGAETLFEVDAEQGRIQAVTYGADQTWIATGGDGGVVQIWGVPLEDPRP